MGEQNMIENGLGYLYYTVLGESILNDAVGITLFDAFAYLVKNDLPITLDSIRHIVVQYCVTFSVSLAIGVAGGMLAAYILKIAKFRAPEGEDSSFNVPELSTVLLLAYLPFRSATAINRSGIAAV